MERLESIYLPFTMELSFLPIISSSIFSNQILPEQELPSRFCDNLLSFFHHDISLESLVFNSPTQRNPLTGPIQYRSKERSNIIATGIQSTRIQASLEIAKDKMISTLRYVCVKCSRAFKRSEHLKRHFRCLHTSQRPFICTRCRKPFSRSDNLKDHQGRCLRSQNQYFRFELFSGK